MNVVVGATGTLGTEICRVLRERAEPVRALVRESSAPDKVQTLRALGAEIVVGDLKSRTSLDDLCRGAASVFSTASALMSQSPDDSFDRVDLAGQQSLIDAAVAAGVRRFVFVSVLALEPGFAFAAAKSAVEAHLKTSGLEYTILQSSCFMDVWLTPHVGFDFAQGTATIYGDGTRAMGWVHSTDVAKVAVAAAADAAAKSAVVGVVGPDRLTPLEVVRIFEDISGRRFEVTHVPVPALHAQFAAAGHPVEQAFTGLMLRYAAGDPAVERTPLVRDRATTSVREFAKQVLGVQTAGGRP